MLLLFYFDFLEPNLILQFFLTVLKSIELRLMHLGSLLKLSLLALNCTFKDIYLTLHLCEFISQLIFFSCLGHGCWVFKVNAVFFLGSRDNLGLFLHSCRFLLFYLFPLSLHVDKFVVLSVMLLRRVSKFSSQIFDLILHFRLLFSIIYHSFV